MTTTEERRDTLRRKLRAHGQDHLLAFHDELDAAAQAHLIEQIEAIELEELAELIERFVRHPETPHLPEDLVPAPFYPVDPSAGDRPWDIDVMRERGATLIAAGRVAAFTVAGGQGTRLGWNGPKGTFPATVVTGKPLFRIFAEQILAAQRAFGVTIPWYIMTSPENDAATRAFFADNNCFGLARPGIMMFPQGTMPSLALETGKLLLADKGSVALNPDGHGGSLKALRASGALDDMRGRGIEHVSYFQVDNPLVRVIDPVFIGLHATAADSSGEMSSKMVPKVAPEEKVGVFGRTGDRTVVIEYSDLPPDLAEARDEGGALRFRAGSIAIHLLGVSFVERLTADPRHFGLPLHRAVKAVPCIDPASGERVTPAAPNAVKLETFVFDALPKAEASIVMETRRADEFAPIKNATGVDSAASSHRLQSERAARWLEARGVRLPRTADGGVDARIEIGPLTALEPGDLADVDLPEAVAPGESLVL